ncbi:hypothetical protein BC828DRAFT_376905 [Blastocladiella britannica]|nr:hypothetical protein BC828DRAFT_376905 [Blastocladiella britannica]
MTTSPETNIELVFVAANTAIAVGSILVSISHIRSATGTSARRYAIGAAACMLALLALDLTAIFYKNGFLGLTYLVQDAIRNFTGSISMMISVGCSIARFRVFATSAAPWYTRKVSTILFVAVMLIGCVACALALIEQSEQLPYSDGKFLGMLAAGMIVVGGIVDFVLTVATFRILSAMGSAHHTVVPSLAAPPRTSAWNLTSKWRSQHKLSHGPSIFFRSTQFAAPTTSAVGLETFQAISTMRGGVPPPPPPPSPSLVVASPPLLDPTTAATAAALVIPTGKERHNRSSSSNRLLTSMTAIFAPKPQAPLPAARASSSNTALAQRRTQRSGDIQALWRRLLLVIATMGVLLVAGGISLALIENDLICSAIVDTTMHVYLACVIAHWRVILALLKVGWTRVY